MSLEELLREFRSKAEELEREARRRLEAKFGEEIAAVVVRELREVIEMVEEGLKEDYKSGDAHSTDYYLEWAVDDLFDDELGYVWAIIDGVLKVIEEECRKALGEVLGS